MGARSMRGAVCALLIVAMGTSGRSARGQDSTSDTSDAVFVVPSTCGELPGSTGAWVELLRVELASDRIEVRSPDGAAPSSAAPRVGVEAAPCDGSATSATL